MSNFEIPSNLDLSEKGSEGDALEVAEDSSDLNKSGSEVVQNKVAQNEDNQISRRDFLKGLGKFGGAAMVAANMPGILTEAEAGDKELARLIEFDNLKMEKVPSLEVAKHEMWELAMNSDVEHQLFVVRKGEQYYKVAPKYVVQTENNVGIMKYVSEAFVGKNIDDFDEVCDIHTHPYNTVKKYGTKERDSEYNYTAQPSTADMENLLNKVEVMMYKNSHIDKSEYPFSMTVESPEYSWSVVPDYGNEILQSVLAERTSALLPMREAVDKMSDEKVLEVVKRNLADKGVEASSDLYRAHVNELRIILPDILLTNFNEEKVQKDIAIIKEKVGKMSIESIFALIKTSEYMTIDLEDYIAQNKKDIKNELDKKDIESQARKIVEDYLFLDDVRTTTAVSESYYPKFDAIRSELLDMEEYLLDNAGVVDKAPLIKDYIEKMRKMGFIVKCEKRLLYQKYIDDEKRQGALDKISGHNKIDEDSW